MPLFLTIHEYASEIPKDFDPYLLIVGYTQFFTDELRHKKYRGSVNPLAGHCYVACEVFFHLNPGKYKPCFIRWEGEPHWYLVERATGAVFDPTVSQFKTVPDYSRGVGKGFLTKKPSKRAQIVLDGMSAHGIMTSTAHNEVNHVSSTSCCSSSSSVHR